MVYTRVVYTAYIYPGGVHCLHIPGWLSTSVHTRVVVNLRTYPVVYGQVCLTVVYGQVCLTVVCLTVVCLTGVCLTVLFLLFLSRVIPVLGLKQGHSRSQATRSGA